MSLYIKLLDSKPTFKKVSDIHENWKFVGKLPHCPCCGGVIALISLTRFIQIQKVLLEYYQQQFTGHKINLLQFF